MPCPWFVRGAWPELETLEAHALLVLPHCVQRHVEQRLGGGGARDTQGVGPRDEASI